MPKNPKLNIARYKVQGGELNEYDFHKNQQAFVQQNEPESMIPGTPPEVKAEQSEKLQELVAGIGRKSPAKTTTKRATNVAKTTSKKSTKKAAKKSTKKAKPTKAARASKSRTSKRAGKRSTKKAAKKSGTKTKARKK